MKVKICGLCRPEDARVAAEAGADYLGVILAPGGPRTQSESRASEIWSAAPGVARVGVLVDSTADEAMGLAERLELSVLQLHGDEAPAMVARVRAAGPWRIWKALRPRNAEEFRAAVARWSGRVDGMLVDGYSERARGGTGTRFPWNVVAGNRSLVGQETELIVAGGLSPSNVATAVEQLAPDGVDVSSGVESERGVKSPERVRSFIAAARAARHRNGGSRQAWLRQ